MIRPVVCKGFFLRYAPRGCSAVVGILETHYMIYVDKGAGLASVEAYGGVRFVDVEVKVRAIVAFCIDGRGYIKES